MFLAVVFAIAACAVYSVLLFIRVYSDPSPSRSAKNERAKLVASSYDRMSTACLVAAFVTRETTLSGLDLGVSDTTKTILSIALWISAAVALHLSGANILARVKDS